MRIMVLSGLVCTLLIAGCAAPIKEQRRAGFLTDYSKLEKVDEERYLYVSDRLGEYDKFYIAPVTMLAKPSKENGSFSDEEIDKLKAYIVEAMTKALTKGDDGYEVVGEPGPGVAQYRLAITALDQTVGALNFSIYTKITGAGLGGMAMEMETVDSLTGEQLGAGVRWGNGSRVLRAGMTKTGDAKILIKRWSKDAREEIDRLHGRGD